MAEKNAVAEVAQAFKHIVSTVDVDERENYLNILAMLLPRKDLVEKVSTMAVEYGLLMDTPYVQEILQRGQKLGWQEGMEQGRQEVMEQGRQEGIIQGLNQACADMVNTIFEISQHRFALTARQLQAVKAQVACLDPTLLTEAVTQAATCQDLEAFTYWLEN